MKITVYAAHICEQNIYLKAHLCCKYPEMNQNLGSNQIKVILKISQKNKWGLLVTVIPPTGGR